MAEQLESVSVSESATSGVDNRVVMRIVVQRPSDGLLLEFVETDDTVFLSEWLGGNFTFRLVESDDGVGVAKITQRIREILEKHIGQ